MDYLESRRVCNELKHILGTDDFIVDVRRIRAIPTNGKIRNIPCSHAEMANYKHYSLQKLVDSSAFCVAITSRDFFLKFKGYEKIKSNCDKFLNYNNLHMEQWSDVTNTKEIKPKEMFLAVLEGLSRD